MKINGKRFAVIALAAFVATGVFAKGFGGLLNKAKEAVGISSTEESAETSNSTKSAENSEYESEKLGIGDLTYKANDEIEIVEGSVSDFVKALHMPDGCDAFYFTIPNISESDFPNEKTVVYISSIYKEMEIPEKINGHTVVGLSLEGVTYKNKVLTIPESIVILGGTALSDFTDVKTINFPSHKIIFGVPNADTKRGGFTDDWFEYCNKLDEKSKSELRRVGYTGKIGY